VSANKIPYFINIMSSWSCRWNNWKLWWCTKGTNASLFGTVTDSWYIGCSI